MDEITNADQLEAWLKNRPREDAVLIAARCALRVFPLLAPVIGSNAEEHRATIILPICRAIAVASVTGAWTTQPMEVSRAAGEAAEAAYALADALAGVTADVDYAAIAADSAYAAAGAVEAYAADNSAVVFAAESAARASAAARYAYSPHLNFFWRMVQDDAIGLERVSSRGRLTEKPLWHAHTPTGIFEPWHELRDHLLAANEGWEVWTEWYQDRLDGKPAIEELEVAKALIANETWDAGPATLNAEISRLIAEHEDDSEDIAERSLEATEPYAASDFGYDAPSNAMEPRPLPNDPPPSEDPYRLRDQADHLSTLSDLAKGLERDFRQDKPQIPQGLRRNLKDYSTEAGKPPEQVRPRMLMALADKFRAALDNEDIRGGMDNYEVSGLEGLMREHLALVAAYYDALAERLQNEIEKYEPPANVDLETLEDTSSNAADLIEENESDPLPAPPPGYVEEVRSEVADLRDGRLRLGLLTDESIRAEGARQLARDNLKIISTASREIIRWTQVVIRDDRFAIPMNVYTALTFVRDALRLFGIM